MKDKFSREYECSFQEDENERYLYELAKEYHERSEAHDRAVCTGRIVNGSIMPATIDEAFIISRSSLDLKKELQERARRERGIDKISVLRAIREFSRRKY